MHDDGRVWVSGRRRLTVGLVLTVTLVAFESLAVSAVMPAVADDLGGLGLYGWVFSGFFLANLLGIVVAGQMADRRSPALPFALGLVLFAAGLLAAGAAPSMPLLVVARLFQGAGAGAIPAIAYACVGRAYPAVVRPRVFAIFSTAWVVPGLVGPATAKAIEHALSWRWVFLALLPLVVVAAAITLPALGAAAPEAGAGDGRAVDRRGLGLAAVLVLGTGALLAGLTSGEPLVAAPLAVAGAPVAVWAFLRLVPPGTIRAAPGMPAAVAVRGVLTFAFFGTDAFIPLVLEDVRDSPGWIAVALTATALTWTVGSWTQQAVVHRVGPRWLVRIGFLVLAVGVGGTILLLGAAPVPLGVVLWAIGGFGIGLSYAPLSTTVLGTAAPGQQGSASAALQLTDVLGVSLGTGLTGVFVAAGEASDRLAVALGVAFAVTLAVALAGSVVARRIPARL